MNLPGLNLPKTSTSTPLKFYSDASHQENGMSFAGWVFADHNGKPLEISGSALGKGWDSVDAEMEAITRGLKGIGSYQQVQHVKVLSDCKPALYHLESMTLDRMFETVNTQWIPREQNQVADMVADGFMVKNWKPPKREVTEP